MIIRCIDRCQIQCDPQLRLQIGVCTQARECQPMCEQEVMSCNVSRLLFTATWSMFAGPVSKIGRAPGLIQGDPPVDAVSQQSRDYLCIIRKSECSLSVEPATFLVQRQREIPMIQGHKGRNTSCQECIYQTIIKIQTAPVDSSLSLGKNARPRDGEAIRIQTEFGHQRYIFWHTVVMVGCHISVLSVMYLARNSCELIPDRQATPILRGCAFNLIGCSCRTPEKICGED